MKAEAITKEAILDVDVDILKKQLRSMYHPHTKKSRILFDSLKDFICDILILKDEGNDIVVLRLGSYEEET